MLTLCMDTSFRYLTLVLIEDDRIIASIQEESFKKQSELIFVRLEELFKKAGKEPLMIDSICISDGPGSYTGVRIAMTIAKTLSQIRGLDLYTISTLRLYSGYKRKTMVIMDARAKRAYVGAYDEGDVLIADSVMSLDEIDPSGYELVGDLSLLGKDDVVPDIADAFLSTKKVWHKVDDIAYLVPRYLKESEAYVR